VVNKIDEASMAGLDLELKDEATAAEDFHSEETPNIWALPDEENMTSEESAEDELEKPSFLRRLTARRKAQDLESFGEDTEEPHILPADDSAADDTVDDSQDDSAAKDDESDDSQADEAESQTEADQKKPAKKTKK